MTTVMVDIFCAILFIAGITIVLRSAQTPRGGEQGSPPPTATYITRIAGTMMAVVALALKTMMTAFALSGD